VVVEDGKAKKILTVRRLSHDAVETMLKICFGFKKAVTMILAMASCRTFHLHVTGHPYPIIIAILQRK